MAKPRTLANSVAAGGPLENGDPTIADVTGLQDALNAKQATLVSGTNIKTVGGQSLLGSGDLTAGAKGVDYQQFDSSGTWTKPSGYPTNSRVLVECWGAGGSGAKSNYAECGSFRQGAGGGGGAYNYRWMLLSDLGATETVTIGAGGAAVTAANTAGNAGGTTSLGTKVYAYGGGGGASYNGGGGGGSISAGATGGPPGEPHPVSVQISGVNNAEGAGGTGFTGTTDYAVGKSSNYKGGGGGATWYSGGSYGKGEAGGQSVWGGGGGGGGGFDGTYGAGAGGVSRYGGNGGAGSVSTTATSGVQPGGGGGGTRTGTSGAGGNGRVRVTVFAGV